MIDIAIVNETEHDITEFEEIISKVFQKTIEVEGIDRYYEVSIIFCTKEKIREINKDYRKLDKVTDVISFALFDKVISDNKILDESNITTLGDIFICVDIAILQARDYEHSVNREIGFLACHGLLHLLGYDHIVKDDETMMFDKQNEILNKLNLKR